MNFSKDKQMSRQLFEFGLLERTSKSVGVFHNTAELITRSNPFLKASKSVAANAGGKLCKLSQRCAAKILDHQGTRSGPSAGLPVHHKNDRSQIWINKIWYEASSTKDFGKSEYGSIFA